MVPIDAYTFYLNQPSVIAAVMAVIAAALVAYLAVAGFGVLMYVFRALGLYTIASRRQIKRPWLSWLPVGDLWILGSISDQYRYVTLRQVRSRRKLLLCFKLLEMILAVAIVCVNVSLVVQLTVGGTNLTEVQTARMAIGPSIATLVMSLASLALGIVSAVYQYIVLYDLYASCMPERKVLFLVLSILFGVTVPFFVFACRKKDGGMPPRRPAPTFVAEEQEPWEKSE